MYNNFYRNYNEKDKDKVNSQQYYTQGPVMGPKQGTSPPQGGQEMGPQRRREQQGPGTGGMMPGTMPTPGAMPTPGTAPQGPGMRGPGMGPQPRPTQPRMPMPTPGTMPPTMPTPPMTMPTPPQGMPTPPGTAPQRPGMRGPGMRPQRPEMRGPQAPEAPGMEMQPRMAPPNFIPEFPETERRRMGRQGHGQFGAPFIGGIRIVPRDFLGCMNKFTFIWLVNGNSFWFYPTYVDGQFVMGFRWRRGYWDYDRINLNRILFLRCF